MNRIDRFGRSGERANARRSRSRRLWRSRCRRRRGRRAATSADVVVVPGHSARTRPSACRIGPFDDADDVARLHRPGAPTRRGASGPWRPVPRTIAGGRPCRPTTAGRQSSYPTRPAGRIGDARVDGGNRQSRTGSSASGWAGRCEPDRWSDRSPPAATSRRSLHDGAPRPRLGVAPLRASTRGTRGTCPRYQEAALRVGRLRLAREHEHDLGRPRRDRRSRCSRIPARRCRSREHERCGDVNVRAALAREREVRFQARNCAPSCHRTWP